MWDSSSLKREDHRFEEWLVKGANDNVKTVMKTEHRNGDQYKRTVRLHFKFSRLV